jgi:hypothetical protein
MRAPSPAQIRKARSLLGLTNDELAEVAICSQSTVTRLQDDKNMVPVGRRTRRLVGIELERLGIVFGDDGVSVTMRPTMSLRGKALEAAA